MYPDLGDVRRVVEPNEAGAIWQDVVRCYHVVRFIIEMRHWAGRHQQTGLQEIKTAAETIISHEVSDMAFLVGAKFAGLFKNGKLPNNLSQIVKFARIDDLEALKKVWHDKGAAGIEAEIQTELVESQNRLKECGGK